GAGSRKPSAGAGNLGEILSSGESAANRADKKNLTSGRNHRLGEGYEWLSNLFGGRTMSALTAGTIAPPLDLPALDGSRFSLEDALRRGPVLAIFFKISCPVCQYAFPYFERIYKSYGGKKISIVGISQNDKEESTQFARHYGVTFPILLEDT